MRIALATLAAALLITGCAQRNGGQATVLTAPPATTAAPASTFTPLVPTAEPAGTLGPTPSQASLFAPVSAADWQTGPSEAAVTLLEYCDFQSPYCAGFARVLKQLRQEFAADLRVVYRQYPLPQNDKARLAAQAAEAAGAQGKFWVMHDWLFETLPQWTGDTPDVFHGRLQGAAAQLGLDSALFRAALDSPEVAARVQKAYETARDTPVPGTPFVLFNGAPFQDQGLTNHWALSTLIRLEKLKARQFKGPPPAVIDPLKNYTARLTTAHGEIVVRLLADKAPLTVNNFVFLARQGWYDGITFHRVITGFAAQSGDPSGTGYGGPGYFISDEIVPDLNFDGPGWVGMANAGPDTNGSQFFITLSARPEFDGKYTLFGQVIQGMEIVERLAPRDPNAETELPPGDQLLSVTIEEQ